MSTQQVTDLSQQDFNQLGLHESVIVWYIRHHDAFAFEVLTVALHQPSPVRPLHDHDEIGPVQLIGR